MSRSAARARVERSRRLSDGIEGAATTSISAFDCGGDRIETVARAEHRHAAYAEIALRRVVVDEPDRRVAAVGIGVHRRDDALPTVAGSEDEHRDRPAGRSPVLAQHHETLEKSGCAGPAERRRGCGEDDARRYQRGIEEQIVEGEERHADERHRPGEGETLVEAAAAPAAAVEAADRAGRQHRRHGDADGAGGIPRGPGVEAEVESQRHRGEHPDRPRQRIHDGEHHAGHPEPVPLLSAPCSHRHCSSSSLGDACPSTACIGRICTVVSDLAVATRRASHRRDCPAPFTSSPNRTRRTAGHRGPRGGRCGDGDTRRRRTDGDQARRRRLCRRRRRRTGVRWRAGPARQLAHERVAHALVRAVHARPGRGHGGASHRALRGATRAPPGARRGGRGAACAGAGRSRRRPVPRCHDALRGSSRRRPWPSPGYG